MTKIAVPVLLTYYKTMLTVTLNTWLTNAPCAFRSGMRDNAPVCALIIKHFSFNMNIYELKIAPDNTNENHKKCFGRVNLIVG